MSDFKIVKLLGSPVQLVFTGGINPTGEYSALTAYSTGDSVSYSATGSSYVAIQATTGNDPTNTTYWQLLADGATDEEVQDNIGSILVDTASVDLAYNDGVPSITATVLPAGVDHDSLNNYESVQHVDHTTVSINAGAGLSGGGDISTTRTLSVNINSQASTSPALADEILVSDVSNSNAIRKSTLTDVVALVAAPAIPHDNLSGVDTSQYHKKISDLTITRDGGGIITQMDWANGDQEVFNRDGNGFITSIVGNIWTKTFTRDGNNRVTAIAYTLT